DAAAGVLDYVSVEAVLARVDGAPGNAEIGGEAGEEDALQAALAQVSGQPRGLAIGLVEGGVAVDLVAVALADDELGMGHVEALDQLGSGSALDAVIGPQHLRAIGEIGRLERLFAGV